ncbi:phosphoglucosamine mutase [Salibacteraceae bacterium]|jgi:phosphomannomutase|nr:phosphoglucosamine mutase [Flavobacteriales bacterium]MDB9701502.1 phosphoglucosamine mutase [Salibacteraceae bacterium]
MTLISSISGTRGTIGGRPGENLTPIDAVKFASAFAQFIKESAGLSDPKVVIGRDARPSGGWLSNVVSATLQASGVHVIDLGLSTTPTVEIAVPGLNANGGIILTASHNPVEWNALKLLNGKGEFISAEEGQQLLAAIESNDLNYVGVEDTGSYTMDDSWIDKHVALVLEHAHVDVEAIRASNLKIAVDAVNSTGGLAIPPLLNSLGVLEVVMINGEPTGIFAHNPEPLKENLTEIANTVQSQKCDMGIVVDPDVDRLALISENGDMFGEEYTLVAIADYYMQVQPGSTVSNLSSSRALRDVTQNGGQEHFASAVGEVNVVRKMKDVDAVIGGEGNGGIIVPDLHYGRDSLIGIALFLSHYVKQGKSMSELKASYPSYHMAKNKVQLRAGMVPDELIKKMEERYQSENIDTIDGLKIDFEEGWVHLRKSNTEPIIRIYTESTTLQNATDLAERFEKELTALI